MTVAANLDAQSHSATVFDTDGWLRAWTRATIERQQVIDAGPAPRYLLEHSPFWQGYEDEAGTDPVWDKPVLTIGSVYSVYGPAYLADDRRAVSTLIDEARQQARDLGAAGVLVFNLPPDAARQWAVTRPPDVFTRLDTAYYKLPGQGADPVMGDVEKRKRTDWRRRWRRATEKDVQLVQHYGADANPHIDRVLELFNGSAVKHGWPALYDRPTVEAVLTVPNASVILAVWNGQTVGAFVAFEHDRRLYLWSGGTDPAMYSEVSAYPFMLYEILAQGVERGWDVIEFGRGNDRYKRQHGFGGHHLWSLWYSAEPGDVEVYRPRLTALHDGMATVAGFEGLAQRP
jgi:hypothetical protein